MKILACIVFGYFVSFYNWETQMSSSSATPNYQVTAENAAGLLFKNKRDRKVLNVDPKVFSVSQDSLSPPSVRLGSKHSVLEICISNTKKSEK